MTARLTVQEVADLMRCEHRTIRRAIKSGELEAALIGGKWLICEDAVDAWFESRLASTVVPRPQRAQIVQRRRSQTTDGAGSVARLRAMEGSRR